MKKCFPSCQESARDCIGCMFSPVLLPVPEVKLDGIWFELQEIGKRAVTIKGKIWHGSRLAMKADVEGYRLA